MEAENKESARDPSLMRLLRTLALNISAFTHHLTEVHKGAAGVWYHDNLALFHLNPQTSPVSSIIPKELKERVAVKLFAAKACPH